MNLLRGKCVADKDNSSQNKNSSSDKQKPQNEPKKAPTGNTGTRDNSIPTGNRGTVQDSDLDIKI